MGLEPLTAEAYPRAPDDVPVLGANEQLRSTALTVSRGCSARNQIEAIVEILNHITATTVVG